MTLEELEAMLERMADEGSATVAVMASLAAEVERLRGEAVLLKAQAEAGASLLLDVQADCVAARLEVERLSRELAFAEAQRDYLGSQLRRREEVERENAALREVVKAVAEADNSDDSICYQLCHLQWFGGDLALDEMETRHVGPCVVEKAQKALEGAFDGQH